MNVIWAYSDGYLMARNEDYDLMRMRRWSVDGDMGRGLAVLLNQDSDLSHLLLWPLQ